MNGSKNKDGARTGACEQPERKRTKTLVLLVADGMLVKG
jgi:hypothetical protein